MDDYTLLELPVIYDLLASHTATYTQMLTSGASYEDFRLCRETILQLQAEINARKASGETTISEKNIDFNEETHT
jgi:hypothetical protein